MHSALQEKEFIEQLMNGNSEWGIYFMSDPVNAWLKLENANLNLEKELINLIQSAWGFNSDLQDASPIFTKKRCEY